MDSLRLGYTISYCISEKGVNTVDRDIFYCGILPYLG